MGESERKGVVGVSFGSGSEIEEEVLEGFLEVWGRVGQSGLPEGAAHDCKGSRTIQGGEKHLRFAVSAASM